MVYKNVTWNLFIRLVSNWNLYEMKRIIKIWYNEE